MRITSLNQILGAAAYGPYAAPYYARPACGYYPYPPCY